jgi:hypothetical protein
VYFWGLLVVCVELMRGLGSTINEFVGIIYYRLKRTGIQAGESCGYHQPVICNILRPNTKPDFQEQQNFTVHPTNKHPKETMKENGKTKKGHTRPRAIFGLHAAIHGYG